MATLTEPHPARTPFMLAHRSRAFGFTWASNVPLPPYSPATDSAALSGDADIFVEVLEDFPPPRALLRSRTNVHFVRGGFRYCAGSQATIDILTEGNRILVYPGPDWVGTPPASLYSTATALLLAFGGLLPMHGSAVVLDGQATLVCGQAGMGKSTTIARLVGAGALLLSDDLTVLHPQLAGGPPMIFTGRRALRLHPDSAATLARTVLCQAPSHLDQGKMAVYPPQADPARAYPLARIVLLGQPASIPAASVTPLLASHFFRHGCLHDMDRHDHRIALLAIATRFVEVSGAPAL